MPRPFRPEGQESSGRRRAGPLAGVGALREEGRRGDRAPGAAAGRPPAMSGRQAREGGPGVGASGGPPEAQEACHAANWCAPGQQTCRDAACREDPAPACSW